MDYEHLLKQVVLAERLREVRALIGFTRIESPGDFEEVAELVEERRVLLARKRPTWVLAAEVRGEDIFLEFQEDVVSTWVESSVCRTHNHVFHEAHTQWRKARHIVDPASNYLGLCYVRSTRSLMP